MYKSQLEQKERQLTWMMSLCRRPGSVPRVRSYKHDHLYIYIYIYILHITRCKYVYRVHSEKKNI